MQELADFQRQQSSFIGLDGLGGKVFFESKNFGARIMDISDRGGHADPTVRPRLGRIAELIKGRHAVKKPVDGNDMGALLVGRLIKAFFRQVYTRLTPVSAHIRRGDLGKVGNVAHRRVDPGRAFVDIPAVMRRVSMTLGTIDFVRQLSRPQIGTVHITIDIDITIAIAGASCSPENGEKDGQIRIIHIAVSVKITSNSFNSVFRLS